MLIPCVPRTTGNILDYRKTKYVDVKNYLVSEARFIVRNSSMPARLHTTALRTAVLWSFRLKYSGDQTVVIIGEASSDSVNLSLCSSERLKVVLQWYCAICVGAEIWFELHEAVC